ncbi:MAG TPA: hypothetical protein VFV67_07205 [Actinophytocola sp.]|uniref:hypothetical protein n=1 Tax=Actinophytocola sp. TaxID=1872138 RepID=UPI002DBF91E4|nr:hypothetical protein [Actinophytocola sp.]HEU5470423.1 hypothetical protein [Actinophytocola sp.]
MASALVEGGWSCGLMRSIERDAFTPATGYPPGIRIDGIDLHDRGLAGLPPHTRS